MAGKRARRDTAKERFWRQTVRRWERSGLSIRGFCLRRAISEASFYAWRRVLVQRDRESGAVIDRVGDGPELTQPRTRRSSRRTATRPSRTYAPSETLPETPEFLPVHVIADGSTGASPVPSIELVLASGTVVRVPRGVDRQTLADVIAVLEQGPC